MKVSHPLVIFDLETTGTWIEKDKIIEIAMIKILPDGTEEIYDQRINPGIPIPPFVAELTGISDEDVKGAPHFREKVKEVLDFIGDADIGGFNVERFDLPLLQREVGEAGLAFNWDNRKVFDCQKVFHLNEKRDLTAAYKLYCEEDLKNAHSALADTRATLDILKAQVVKYGEGDDSLDSLQRFDYTNQPDFYDDDRKFRWWNGRLYMMFGKYARKYSLQEMVKKDPAYLEWVLSANFGESVKNLIRNALNGIYPIPVQNNDDKPTTED